MQGKILDTFKEASSVCYLTSIDLGEYIKALPEDYRDYEVQREIVSNAYLDNLISTILEMRHIPPIVLVIVESEFVSTEQSIDIKRYKILDGLQRTFRLKIIHDTIELFKVALEKDGDLFSLTRITISKRYKEALEKINSSSSLLYKLIEFFKADNREVTQKVGNLFKRNQWFEIWTNLSPEQEVNKMLALNAGHKPVKTKHQLELLFRNIIPVLQKLQFSDLQVIREKELSSTLYSKDRLVGQFHFSHLITSLLSFVEGKPLTTNINLIQKAQNDSFDEEAFDKFLNIHFLKKFIGTLLRLDKEISKRYPGIGTKWMGRETSLVGIFAAVGKLSSNDPINGLELLDRKVGDNPSLLHLEEFERQRNSLDLAKVNIGSVNKKAVYNGVFDILSGKASELDWAKYFKGEA